MSYKTNPLKTKKGTDIPKSTRGILYLCNYDMRNNRIKVVEEILYNNSFDARNAYTNIPNPSSQIATGETFDELIHKLQELHENMDNAQWVKDLANYI